MNKYLLDTNVVSELRKRKPHGAVLAWLGGLQEEQILLSAVTMGELQAGVELTRTQDPQKAEDIEHWLDQIADSYQVVPMDAAVFREWGRLMHGQSNALIEDGMIAATARIHGLIIATRNERDFRLLHVEIVNPFKPGGSRSFNLEGRLRTTAFSSWRAAV